jgi:hypothetical protein
MIQVKEFWLGVTNSEPMVLVIEKAVNGKRIR